MKILFTHPMARGDNCVEIKDETVVDSTTDYVTLQPGQCAILGVDLIIDANAPCYKTLAASQVNIEKVPVGEWIERE